MQLHTQRRKPSVGLTSLIDVIFILIVFFMLVSTFSQFRSIDLLSSSSSTSPDSTVTLTLLGDGQTLTTATGSIEQQLQIAIDQQLPVIVELTAGITVQSGVDVLERLQQRGVKAVSLVPYRGTPNAAK